ncbi:MAG: hypothetical protein M3Y37_11615 [Chloroflexota bacterium]|nr:hypothetical protein [Chloroflexota bacterium]
MLKIEQIRTYRGPNIWTDGPAIALLLDPGEVNTIPANEIHSRLRASLPGYRDHPGLPLATCTPAMVVGQIALDLQRMTGANVSFCEIRGATESGPVRVLYGYESIPQSRAAGCRSAALIDLRSIDGCGAPSLH